MLINNFLIPECETLILASATFRNFTTFVNFYIWNRFNLFFVKITCACVLKVIINNIINESLLLHIYFFYFILNQATITLKH